MMRRSLGPALALALAAAAAMPADAATDNDCRKASAWKPTPINTRFKRVKVQISVINKTDSLITADFNWTDTAGNTLQELSKSMLKGQEVKNEMTIKGVDGTADFQTVLGERGTARFQIDFKNKQESRFKPAGFPNGVTCDLGFGDKDNIWKIHYVVKSTTPGTPSEAVK